MFDTIHLSKGEGTLSLQATKIPGLVAKDVRFWFLQEYRSQQ